MQVQQRFGLVFAIIVAGLLAFAGMAAAQDDDGDETAPPLLGVTVVEDENGAAVARVLRGSAADDAGILPGDVITAVNGDAVTANGLPGVIAAFAVGDQVTLTLERDGEPLDVDVVLGEQTAFGMGGRGGRDGMRTMPRIIMGGAPMLGIEVSEVENGLQVEAVNEDSAAAEAGLLVGDIIVSINGAQVNNTQEARLALIEAGFDEAISIEVLRDGETVTLEITLEIMPMREFMIPLPGELGLQYLGDENAWEITELSDDNALSEAGLQVGDKIVAINGAAFDNARLPRAILELLEAETETATLTVDRDGETIDIELNRDGLLALFGNVPRMMERDFGEMMPFDFEMPHGNMDRFDFEFPEAFGMMGPNRALLGVTFVTLNEDVAAENDVDVTEGALVIGVAEAGPAAEAGIVIGDIITAVDGDVVDEERTLLDRIAAYEPDDVVTLAVLRDGETLDIEVTLLAFEMGEGFFFDGRGGRFDFEHPPVEVEPMEPDVEETPEPSL